MKNKTSIELLENKLKNLKHFFRLMEDLDKQNTVVEDNIFEQAKEAHKQEIIAAYQNGRSDQQSDVKSIFYNTNAEIYYNETFTEL
jgi:hypothetical protein